MISMGSLDSVHELLVKNQELQRELDEASIRLTSQAALEAENNELRAVIGKVSTSTYKIAPVLKRPPFSGYDELILDIGESEGIASGALVYSPGSVLIGKIESVFGHTSKAVLFTSPKQSHEVFIGSSKASAVAIGRGGGQYVAEVPRDIVVNPGDTVTASSLANRPFAIVSSVLNDPAQPFEKIFMSPPVNIYEIRWVLVQNTKE